VKETRVPQWEAESRDGSFASTRWTIVLEAGDSATVSAHAFSALSELCQIYWRPLYSFLRKQGYGPEDARDLTQLFADDQTRAYATPIAKDGFVPFSSATETFRRGRARSRTGFETRRRNDSPEPGR
jgi:hypothetical protein